MSDEKDLAERGVKRLISYNQRMLALCRETGDEPGAQIYERFLKSFEEYAEYLPFFGMLLEGMLEETERQNHKQNVMDIPPSYD